MNHIYRVIFNRQTGTFQAVAETAKTPHKTGKTKSAKIFKALLTPISLALSLAFGLSAHASPKDGQVTAGVATIHQNGLITDINQTSQNAAINWQSFNIAHNETVNFNQPNAGAVTLNRVIGNEKSVIDGAMNANGKVFISNANGMLIGKDAKINVGSLVATTANISDDDLMNGRYQFTGGQGSIENLGQISVPKGGMVALVAPIVKNGGKITAHEGNVLLASAENFSITLPDNANFKYTLDKGTLQGLVDNGGAILADGGRVVLTAKGVDTVKKSLIKHSGNIEANTVQNKNGVIELLGDLDNSALTVSGSLKAEAKESGDGGFIETSASQVKIEDGAEISTNAQNGDVGTWTLAQTNALDIHNQSTISGKQLSKSLNNTNIDIESKQRQVDSNNHGTSTINVNETFDWNKNDLRLIGHNSLNINNTINASDKAKLHLQVQYDDYHIREGAKVNLPVGKSLTIGYNRANATEYTVVHDLKPLTLKDGRKVYFSDDENIKAVNIALGKDLDLAHLGKDFTGADFSGNLHGLGHDINNFNIDTTIHSDAYINDWQKLYIGLFSQIPNTDSKLRDFNLKDSNINVRITGNAQAGQHWHIGGLVGAGNSHTYNVHRTGNISVSSNRNDHITVGGLIGDAGSNGTIAKSSNKGDVSGSASSAQVGGLAGNIYHISQSFASGKITAKANDYQYQDINNKDYAQINNAIAGGLTGFISTRGGTSIEQSYATGEVVAVSNTGNAYAGGLIGQSGTGSIYDSYAENTISSQSSLHRPISSNKDFKPTSASGGIVGLAYYYFDDDDIALNRTYFNGKLSAQSTGEQYVGGLAGYKQSSGHTRGRQNTSYFNHDTSGAKRAIGNLNPRELVFSKKGSQEMTAKNTFTDWDFDKVWYINDGETPKLHAHKKGTIVVNPVTPPTNPNPPTSPTPTPANKTDLAVQANNLNKVYDGEAVATENDLRAIAIKNGYGDIISVTGLKNGDTLDKLGTVRYDGTGNTWQNAKNAGEYKIVPSGLIGGQDYEIKYGEGKLTIDKKPITIAVNSYYDGTDTAKIYDKNDKFFGKQIMGFNGIVKGDDVSLKLGTTGTLYSNQAGNTTLKDLGNLALEGASANNYTINKDGSTWTINKRPIKVTGSREYNGSEWVNGADLNIDKSDIIGKDQILLNVYTGDVKLDGKDAKNGRKVVDASKIYFGGKDGENYEIDKLRSSVDIKPKNISVEVSKEYDGTNEFTKGFKIKGIIDGENPNIHISKATVAGKDNISDDVDYDKFTSISIAMPDKNYKFENGKNNVVAKILPKTIVVTPKDGQKIRFNQDDYKNLSYTHSQLVGNDKITGYLQPNNPNVGTRKFGLGTLSAGKNYELVLSNDKYVEITPIPLTIQAIDQSYNTAKNVLSGMGAKDNFNRKLFNIVKDKNLKYPDQILYAGGLGIENERDLQFITAPTGKYDITRGDLNFYGNYDINFIPATYTVYTQYPNPILDRIIRVGDKIIGAPEGIALDTVYPVVDGVVEGVQGAGYWVARSVKDAEGLPTGQAALVIIWGGVAALGEVASAGLTVATLDKASAVVLVVKGFGTYTIKNTQFLTGWTNEQVQQYVKAYQNTVDILNMLRSTKDWYSLIRSDDPQAKAKFFKDLRKQGKSDKEIREAYNYFRSLGANGQNIEIMLNADNILSTAYDMLSFTQDNFPEAMDKIPTIILEKLE